MKAGPVVRLIAALLLAVEIVQSAVSPLCTADTHPLPAVVEVSGDVTCTTAGTTEILVVVDLTIQCSTPATLNGFRFVVEDGATVRITGNDITFQGSDTTLSGGVFKVENGTLNFEWPVTFNQNSAETGGAILHKHGAINFLSTATFTDNVASMSGGAIATFEGTESTITFSSPASFTGNTAGSGGAVSLLAGVLTFGDNAVFEDNVASVPGLFDPNYPAAVGSGGAIYIGAGTLIMGDSATFTRNTAESNGGGIMLEFGEAIFGDNAVFTENHAYYGGGACFWRNTTMGDFATFIGNTAYNVTLDDPSDYGFAGGLFARTDRSFLPDLTVITLGDYAYFKENETSFRGGAIQSTRAVVNIGAFATFTSNYAFYGGAVFEYQYQCITTIGDRVVFQNNTAYGGGAFLSQGISTFTGLATFEDNSGDDGGAGAVLAYAENIIVSFQGPAYFARNNVPYSGNGHFGGLGGAVLCSGNMEFLDTATFEENSAQIGGAFTLFDEPDGGSSTSYRSEPYFANLNFYGDVYFNHNTAEVQGGALDIETGGSANFWAGSYFTGNTANRGGGAYFNTKYAQFSYDRNASLSNAVFTQNIADVGGGLFIQSGTAFIMQNVSFYDNLAHTDGAGAYIFDCPIAWSDSYASGNTAGDRGGAMALVLSVNAPTSTFAETEFNGKESTLFDNVHMSDNVAKAGGALYLGAGDTEVKSCEFTRNTAVIGGSVYITFDLHVDFSKSKFTDGSSSSDGGAVFIERDATIVVTDSQFTNCSSGSSGGSMYCKENTHVSLKTSSFVNSTAATGGGGVGGSQSCTVDVAKDTTFDNSNSSCCFGLPLNTTGPVVDSCSDVNLGDDISHCCLKYEYYTSQTADADICTVCNGKTMECNALGITLQTLPLAAGYWRPNNNSLDISKCASAAACGASGIAGEDVCEDGYEGPFCGVCQAEYARTLGGRCLECTTAVQAGSIAILVVGIIVIVLGTVTLAKVLWEVDDLRAIGNDFADEVAAPTLQMTIMQRFKSLPWGKLRIILIAEQLIVQFVSITGATLPPLYRSFLSALVIVQLDLGFGLSFGCFINFSYYRTLLLKTLVPLGLFALLGCSYIAILMREKHLPAGHIRAKSSYGRHLNTFLFMTWILYSTITTTVFQAFDCVEVDKVNYLRADYSLLCSGDKYHAYRLYAAVMVAIFPVGVPLIYLILLFKSRKAKPTRGKDPRADFSFLVNPYRPDCSYWEVGECARRLYFTGFVLFIYPKMDAQLAISGGLSLIMVVATFIFMPFKDLWDTYTHLGGSCALFLTIFLALNLDMDVTSESSQSQQAFAIVLIILHILLLLTVLFQLVMVWVDQRRTQSAYVSAVKRAAPCGPRMTPPKKEKATTGTKVQAHAAVAQSPEHRFG